MKPCLECGQCSTRKDSVFHALSPDETTQMQELKNHLVFHYGELIFKEGQFPSGIYVVNKGKVKVFKSGFEGREQIIKFAKPGDIVGYRSAVSEEKYTCSASAISETHLCFVPLGFLNRALRNNPELGLRFMKLLAAELRAAEDKAVQMAQKTVRERVAEALLLLKEVYGYEDDNATLNIDLKREELAGLAGTVRETVTRFLSEFTESQIISLSGKKIRILDLQRLIHNARQSW